MVTATGHRTFYMIYRARNTGLARAHKIGPADDLSFKEARQRAETIRGLVAQGRDPVAEEQATRDALRVSPVPTVRECVNYFVTANRERLDPKTAQAHEQSRDALPRTFMDTPAEEVTPAMFREAVKDATSAPIMQNRHLGRLKAVLRFAHQEQKIARLPSLVGMKRPYVEKKRERVLKEAEIRVLWQAVDTVAPTMPRGGLAFAAAVRTMLLVGTRLGETTLAAWDELDLDGSAPRSQSVPKGQPVWYVPAEHRKGERGKKRPHWVLLPPLAVSVFRNLQSVTGDKPLIFWKAGYSARTYMLGKLLAEMGRLGHAEPWTFHDLRRTCSTWLGELGCPQELNDLILGHSRKGVIAHYDHSQRLADRVEWLRRWSEKVSDIVGLSRTHEALLHVYRTATGLPEIKATREPDKGRLYVGAFRAMEAVKKAEQMTREVIEGPSRAPR